MGNGNGRVGFRGEAFLLTELKRIQMRNPKKKQREREREILVYFNGTKKIIILFICVHASGSSNVSIFRRPEYILDRYGLSALDVDGYALPVTNWILNHFFSFYFMFFSFSPSRSFFLLLCLTPPLLSGIKSNDTFKWFNLNDIKIQDVKVRLETSCASLIKPSKR